MTPENTQHNAFDVRIGETEVGLGLYVTREFSAGEEILRFHGPRIDYEASLAKGESECNAFQIGPGVYLDLEAPGVFINHSCDPNTGIRDDIRLVALRDLKAGEEIRFDYSTTMNEDHWELECLCGTSICRGFVRDFKWLPRERKLELIALGVVPEFILEAERESGRLSAGDIAGVAGHIEPERENPNRTRRGRLPVRARRRRA